MGEEIDGSVTIILNEKFSLMESCFKANASVFCAIKSAACDPGGFLRLWLF